MTRQRLSEIRSGHGEQAQQRRSACGLLVAVAAGSLLAGCGLFSKAPPPPPPPPPAPPPPPPPKPGTLSFNVVASGSINPDIRRRPSPVVIRIYELKNSAVFESADFVSLYDKDAAVLGADIVSRDEFVLKPSEIKTVNKALASDTKFVAVFAAFRDLERAKWRAVAAVLPNKNNLVTIALDGNAVQAAVTST